MNAKFAIGLATLYLVVYTGLLAAGVPLALQGALLTAAPVVLIWAVYRVLKDKSFQYPELSKDEEWGYLDEPR